MPSLGEGIAQFRIGPHDGSVGQGTPKGHETMKKLIFISMLSAVGLLAQTSGNTPAPAQKQNNATPAAPAAKAQHHRHKKNSNVKPSGTAATPAPSNSSTPAPAKK
jgi:hypothetical protein